MPQPRRRFAEPIVYFWHVVSLFQPGRSVPTFDLPREFGREINSSYSDDDLRFIVEEGRRQLDRQLSDLEHIRSRANALLTLCIAEIAVLSASAERTLGSGQVPTLLWLVSATFAALAAAGAASVSTSRAVFGRIDTQGIARSNAPILRRAADTYPRLVDEGETTLNTRTTVLRDAVLLAVAAAVIYAVVWPFTSRGGADAPAAPTPSIGVPTCQPTCTGTPPVSCPTSEPAHSPTATVTTTPQSAPP